MASAAHPGRPDVPDRLDGRLRHRRDATPCASDPELDLFNERNGPPFSDDFIERYRAAQIARNQAITDWAETELKRVHAAGFFGPVRSRCCAPGPIRGWSTRHSSRPSARPTCATPGPPVKANRSAHGIAAACTLRNWIGMWSLRHAQTRAEPHLARIDCPALVINAEQDTGVYPSDAQRIHDALAQPRQVAVRRSTPTTTSPPRGPRSEQADTIAKWIAKRWR